jgi:predicted PurR-regulated permease PerM
VPRWLAILVIYIAIVAMIVLLGLMVIPPLVAQAGALWDEIPDEFNRLQSFLIRYKLMTRRITLAEAVSSAPSGSGGNAVGTVLVAISSLIGGITAVAVAISVSPKLALMVGTYFLVLHQFEANILVPKIMERSVGVSPVAVLVALLIGGALWGLVGAILAIPTVALLSVIVEEIAAEQDARVQRIK